MRLDKISVVIPCYNEEPVLPLFYEEMDRVSREMEQVEFELLFVDDGSQDGTLKVIKDFSLRDERVKYISFSRNFGKEAAMHAGLSASTGDYVCIIDADLQEPPALIQEMYDILSKEDYDCAATRRVSRDDEPKSRSFFATKFYKIINIISDDRIEIVDGARDYRLMTRQMTDAVLSLTENSRFSKGIFAWVGFKTKWIPFAYSKRKAGETSWSFFRLFLYALDGFMDFSSWPLVLGGIGGSLLTGISVVMFLINLVRRLLFNVTLLPQTDIINLILFIGGLQLLCIGILGMYLGKTYKQTKKRPSFIVKETNTEDRS